jgi:hypothetical protein
VKRFGRLDVLVNNAGVSGARLPVDELEPDDFDRVIGVNLRGNFLCAKYAIPHLLQARAGCMINITSTYGVIAAPLSAAYCASNHHGSGPSGRRRVSDDVQLWRRQQLNRHRRVRFEPFRGHARFSGPRPRQRRPRRP